MCVACFDDAHPSLTPHRYRIMTHRFQAIPEPSANSLIERPHVGDDFQHLVLRDFPR